MHVIGQLGIVFALVVVSQLSKRLGKMTHAKPYYRGFYAAAALLTLSAAARFVNETFLHHDPRQPLWILINDAVPAFALTLGVGVAWRYWSWLLAERD